MSETVEEKMTAHMFYERGLDYFNHGDYQAARRDLLKALRSEPKADIEKKSRELLKKLSIDPVEIIVGVATLMLVLFLFIYFGLVR